MPVAILGAGRSGTSMVSGMLSQCGLYMGEPDDLENGDSRNPNGYWEHPAIRDVTQRVLGHLEAKFGSPALAEQGWEDDPALEPFYAEAVAATAYFRSRSDTWGWKYPPASLIIPFWRRAAPDLRFVLCVRNPADVTTSIVDLHSLGKAQAENLWLLHTVRVLVDTRPQERFLTHYEDYFPGYRTALLPLLDFIGLPQPPIGSALDLALSAYNRTDLKHHNSSLLDFIEDQRIPYAVKQLYIELRDGPSDGSQTRLLQVSELFLPAVARAVAVDAQRQNLEQILNSRTHRLAAAMLAAVMRSPLGALLRLRSSRKVAAPKSGRHLPK